MSSRKFLSAAAAAVLLVTPAAGARTPAKPSAAQSLTERNRAIVTDFADLFYTRKDVRTAFDKYVVPDYIQHNPDVPDGRDAAKNGLSHLFGPNANLKIQHIIVDGNLAVIHLWARFSPTDRGMAVSDIYRLKDGKIVEHWDMVQRVPEKPRNPRGMF